MIDHLATQLLELSRDPVVVIDAAGHAIAANGAASRLLPGRHGRDDPATLDSLTFTVSVPDGGCWTTALKRSSSGSPCLVTIRVRNGGEIDFSGVGKFLGSEQRPLFALSLVPVADDAATTADDAAEMMFQRLVVSSSDDAIIRESVEGLVTSWNSGAERMFGFSAAEIIGRPANAFIGSGGNDDEARVRRAMGDAPAESKVTFEAVRKHRDGSLLNVAVTLSPIVDAAGTIVGLANVKKNITDRQIQQSRADSIIEAIPSGIVTIDDAGVITRVNDQLNAIFGYDRDELVGTALERLLPERYRSSHVALRDNYIQNPQKRLMGQGLPLMGRRKDGGEVAVEVGLSKIAELSGDRYMAIITDVSARLATEHMLEERRIGLERSNEELSAFAYVASHDLKSPLRGIDQLATWIIEDMPEDGRALVQDHVTLMQARIRRMEKLLDDLLAYSRAGRVETNIETVSLGKLALDTLGFMTSSPHVQLGSGPIDLSGSI